MRTLPRRAQLMATALLVAAAMTGIAAAEPQADPCTGCPPAGVWPGDRSAPPQVCRIQDNNTGYALPLDSHGDPLFQVLSEQRFCPENALVFRKLLEDNGLSLHPAMVGNRGFHNPWPAGSFSFFEAVTGEWKSAGDEPNQSLELGDFFFGHFTAASFDSVAVSSILAPQQAATPNNLLLESVVWDPRKGMFNFYEIRGDGEIGVWFYRGDSLDILKDIKNLDRNYAPNQLLFGEEALGGARLRCSGCHMNGGPIMKELKFPHDSWWRTERPLPLAAMQIAPALQPILAAVVDAGEFAEWVKAGDEKLFESARYWALRNEFAGLQEQLRPLFCEQEVNLESDTQPYERPAFEGVGDQGIVRAPAGFFIDPRLLPVDLEYVILDYGQYQSALVDFDSLFLDFEAGGARTTDSMDGDHAFETPVKSWSDMALVKRMVDGGLITEEFLADVLAIDMTQPMFSVRRCSLLRLVPNTPAEPTVGPLQFDDWIDDFVAALWQQLPGGQPDPEEDGAIVLQRLRKLESLLDESQRPSTWELLFSLVFPERSAQAHRDRALTVMRTVQANAGYQDPVTGYVRLLAQRRIAVFHDQISQHPQGQIFEPDFRLIFPTMQLLRKDQNEVAYGGVPGQYWLNPTTGLAELVP